MKGNLEWLPWKCLEYITAEDGEEIAWEVWESGLSPSANIVLCCILKHNANTTIATFSITLLFNSQLGYLAFPQNIKMTSMKTWGVCLMVECASKGTNTPVWKTLIEIGYTVMPWCLQGIGSRTLWL